MATNAMATARAVVVTGASSGIGEACALHLDKLSFRVFAGVRQEAAGDALRQRASDRLMPLLIDVTDADTIAAAVAMVATAAGEAGLAGLVNNAGIAIAGPLEFLPIAELRRQLEVNVIGQIAVTQAFLPLLRKGQGRIINIGSVSGRVASPFQGPYCASKFALEALTTSLRMELRPWNIPVVMIEPGIIATQIREKSVAAAEEIARNLPPQAHELYDPALAALRKNVIALANTGLPVDAVAKAVIHALTAPTPKDRYVVMRKPEAGIRLDRLRIKLIRVVSQWTREQRITG
jgi:NAD(P)-dependent dehydrogenase (short-subunit alcohol dehydrogenase family)